jgi:CheY-like chemotaxis protein
MIGREEGDVADRGRKAAVRRALRSRGGVAESGIAERRGDLMNGTRRQRDRPLILVVDDVEDGRLVICDFLALRGFETATAVDGASAVEQATELVPDLILMDVWLPEIDGFEATRRIKADPRTAHVPILALTAHALASARAEAEAAGCDGVITKPFFPRDLEREVRRHLGLEAAEE